MKRVAVILMLATAVLLAGCTCPGLRRAEQPTASVAAVDDGTGARELRPTHEPYDEMWARNYADWD